MAQVHPWACSTSSECHLALQQCHAACRVDAVILRLLIGVLEPIATGTYICMILLLMMLLMVLLARVNNVVLRGTVAAGGVGPAPQESAPDSSR